MSTCQCKNTCSRGGSKRGSCPCKKAGRQCTSLCSCTSSVGCQNRERAPVPIEPTIVLRNPSLEEDLVDMDDIFMNLSLTVRTGSHHDNTILPLCLLPFRQERGSVQTIPRSSQQDVQPEPVDPIPTPRRPKPAAPRKRRPKAAATHTAESQSVDVPPLRAVATLDDSDVPVAIQQHKASIQTFVAGLSQDHMQSILTEMLFSDQGAYQDYVLGYRPDLADQNLPVPDDPTNPPEPEQAPAWCRCGNCRPMPIQDENKCCWMTRMTRCVTEAPNFYQVITPGILDLAMAGYNDILVHDQEQCNRAFRHAAYRQYVLMRYGRCGHGNRHVVPSCCVLAIRRRFPDPRDRYTGFKRA